MKRKYIAYLGMALLSAVGLGSCQADMDAPGIQEPVATMQANTTIAELKTAFAGSTMKCPMKDEESSTPYIIHGRVISSDASGNIYKSIAIQDETAAIALSINQSSTYVEYRIGQEVVMDVTGLYIGYYNGLQQIGWLGDPYDGEDQLTFMAWDIFRSHTELNGFPNDNVQYVSQSEEWPSENPYCIVTGISDLPTSGEEFRNMQSQLVEFRNVHFEDGGKETYAPYQESVNRNLLDASGNTIIVRTSGYSTFYNDTIPEGTGTVRGILSYYGSAWQLLLRGKGDVMIDQKGQQDDPYTVSEALEVMDQGASGWVTGYIVGSIRAGVQTVTSSSDIVFGSDAELDNNLVMAASADETDWTKCLAVELPQGSDLRKYGNLIENPSVYKKAISVQGNIATYLGMGGVCGTGESSTFEIEGVDTGSSSDNNAGAVSGDGTQDNPYTVAAVMASSTDESDVWVEGYVVGYIPDKAWSGAVFSNEATEGSDNYTNGTNLVLSYAQAGSADATNSIPVGLSSSVREALAISKNASIYGSHVKLKGNLTAYFGQRGLKAVSEYVIGDAGETPTTPTTSTTIYEGLSSSSSEIDWTFDNVTLPSSLSSIWSWKSYNSSYYLNASAYTSSGTYDSEAYAVSPVIDLTGVSSPVVSFEHAAKFQTTLLTEGSGLVVRESGSTTWTNLTIPTWPTVGSWTFASSGDIDLSAYAGKKIELAFRYVSTTAGADTWEIRNLKVTGNK